MGKENWSEKRLEYGSMVGKITDLGFSTYDRVLFEGLTFSIRSREVTAISGKSGSGKTVILKILAGQEIAGAGKVELQSPRVSYVPQELDDLDIDPNTTIRDLLKEARGLTDLEGRIARFEQELADGTSTYDEISGEYGEALEVYQELDGYNPEPEMTRVLSGLGVDEKTSGHILLDTKLNEVSNGQLRKIMIARALYSNPDLLLLDDPASHLDVASVKWLADYLKNTKSAVVIASNSREFVDSCATQTIGLTDVGRVFLFTGGYTQFEQKRDTIIESEKVAASVVADKLDQLRETDKMFRSKQVYKRSADMAQVGRALETRMRKLEEQYSSMPGSQDVFRNEQVKDLKFEQEERSGNDVVVIKGLVKRYGEFTALNLKKSTPLTIHRGEKWLVWGPNGSGKSTLTRMIVHTATGGDFLPTEGELSVGSNVKIAYFTPEDSGVSKHGLLIEEATRVMDNKNNGRATAVLRFFGFSGASVYNQDVSTLSSGEKKRLALAKIMLKNPNLIILDEPTGDYMSDEIKDRLASALQGYDGTLILVSHDTSFIDKLKLHKELHMPQGKVVIRS